MFQNELETQKTDLDRQIKIAAKYADFLNDLSIAINFPASLLAAIISRESGWGLLLKPQGPHGTGDFFPRHRNSFYRKGLLPDDGLGFGRGLMQIDYDYHEFARTGNWKDPYENIKYGCGILEKHRGHIAAKTKLDNATLMRATVASFNCGVTKVLKAIRLNLDCDFYTANRNYSKDVMLRAKYF